MKYLMEENSNQNKRNKYEPEKDKNRENSRSHSDMLDEKVLIPIFVASLPLYLVNSYFILSVFNTNV